MKNITVTTSITNRSEESLKLYFKDIYKYSKLPFSEEKLLSERIQKGDKAALEKLVKANLRFVVTVAKQYQGQGLSLMDLINEGNLGLLEAAKRFDGEKGFKFISYAVWWIRQSIIQAIYNYSKTIRFPVTQITRFSRVKKASSKLETILGRTPTLEEISEEVNIPEEEISKVLLYNNSVSSMDETVNDENYSTVGDMIPSKSITDLNLIQDSNKAEIKRILDKLGKREQDILRMFFGIDMRELTLDEIGDRFGMTGERIRQLKELAIKHLRNIYDIKM